ncbi:hypothetical protein AAFF_G00335670 [Aldrovandia affinis]|uniref:Uncharacterized protein n=1 Tax=Aldrovandia affinis TaxID=143900 RepID=A0AAD7SLB1_9TELE|nr:hypothetical protein AAFF_G00335670 [Aldrovandia affinis]
MFASLPWLGEISVCLQLVLEPGIETGETDGSVVLSILAFGRREQSRAPSAAAEESSTRPKTESGEWEIGFCIERLSPVVFGMGSQAALRADRHGVCQSAACLPDQSPGYNESNTPDIGILERQQRLKLSKPVVRRVKVWSSEARERLSAWLERAGCDQGLMEWAGPEAGNNLDEYTDTVISFISFCEEVCVPVRTRKIYNNDKPWFTAQLRRLRSEKEEARRSGDKDRFKEAKYRFAKASKEAKHRFSEKLQQQFSEGNPASVWKGLKTITNYKPKSPQTSDNLSLANELN